MPDAISMIKKRFEEEGSPCNIPLLKGNSHFVAALTDKGIEVDNLSYQPLLPWEVFIETVNLLKGKGGVADRGDAMNYKLGDSKLPVDSLEGHIAHVVYQKKVGQSVFRRVTPISGILIWAGVCKHVPKKLVLIDKTI